MVRMSWNSWIVPLSAPLLFLRHPHRKPTSLLELRLLRLLVSRLLRQMRMTRRER